MGICCKRQVLLFHKEYMQLLRSKLTLKAVHDTQTNSYISNLNKSVKNVITSAFHTQKIFELTR